MDSRETNQKRIDWMTAMRKRCQDADLEFKDVSDDPDIERKIVGWEIGNGAKDTGQGIHVSDPSEFGLMLQSRFEDYRPVGMYSAVWSSKHQVVEAELVLSPSLGHPLFQLILALDPKRALATRKYDSNTLEKVTVSIPTEPGGPVVEICFASMELKTWKTGFSGWFDIIEMALVPAIRISGIHLSSRVEAQEAVETWGTAALLELRKRLKVSGRLVRLVPLYFPVWKLRRLATKQGLQPLVQCHNHVPTSLFLQAASEKGNSTLQFLLFYQTIEYFFTSVSIKHKTTSVTEKLSCTEREQTELVRRVLEISHPNGVGRELEQMVLCCRKALRDDDEIRRFIKEFGLEAFYERTQMPIVRERVDVARNGGLIGAVCRRMYKIRCRIVHTKEQSHTPVLFSFGAEAASLHSDLVLMEFLAERVLGTLGTPPR